MLLKILQVLIISKLNLMTEVDNLLKILLVVLTVIYSILDTTVEVYCKN